MWISLAEVSHESKSMACFSVEKESIVHSTSPCFGHSGMIHVFGLCFFDGGAGIKPRVHNATRRDSGHCPGKTP